MSEGLCLSMFVCILYVCEYVCEYVCMSVCVRKCVHVCMHDIIPLPGTPHHQDSTAPLHNTSRASVSHTFREARGAAAVTQRPRPRIWLHAITLGLPDYRDFTRVLLINATQLCKWSNLRVHVF